MRNRMRVWSTSAADLADAADVLRARGLVAFPTETVYGLGANALDAVAVERVFAAKGRPPTNPVIVHVAEARDVERVAGDWPAAACRLSAAFWPGPLTLVLPKRADVPDIVTAGGPTVGVRCPNHPVARAFIRFAGVPVAAPSANRSTQLSPTRTEHVIAALEGRIDGVIDGGPCSGGIESTVLDVTGEVPRLLRPGLISQAQLEAVVGPVAVGAVGEVARSPGQMVKHYSPRTPVRLMDDINFNEYAVSLPMTGKRVGMIELFGPQAMPSDPAGYAAALYARLHELDGEGFDVILIELPPDTPEWAAVRDRLTRAAS